MRTLEDEQRAHIESIRAELGGWGRHAGDDGGREAHALSREGERGGSARLHRSDRRDLPFSYLCLACHGEGVVREPVRRMDTREGSSVQRLRDDSRAAREREEAHRGSSTTRCCSCEKGRSRAARWRRAAEEDADQVLRARDASRGTRSVRSPRQEQAAVVPVLRPAVPSTFTPAAGVTQAESLGSILRRLSDG